MASTHTSRCTGRVNAISLLCPIVPNNIEAIKIDVITKHWRENGIVETDRSIGDAILDLLLDPEFVCDVSDVALYGLFSTVIDVDGAACKTELAYLPFNGLNIRKACTQIVNIMGYSVGTPQLQQYEELVAVLDQLSLHEQRFVRTAMEKRYGSITLLASRVSQGNINFFMNKIKITNSVPLLHQVFRAPSIRGKVNALWKLLELTGVLWRGLPWLQIQDIVQAFYSFLAWFMEKLNLAKIFASEGFEWVKAKVVRSEEDEAVTLQTEALVDLIAMVKNANGCNDCMYAAVAPQLQLDTQRLKTNFITFLDNLSQDEMNAIFRQNSLPDVFIEQDLDEVKRLCAGAEMKDDRTACLLSHFVQRNIVIRREDVHYDCLSSRACAPLFIDLDPVARHFTPSSYHGCITIPYWGGEQAQYPDQQVCGLCSSNYSNSCPSCQQPVCTECYLKCCVKTPPVEVKKTEIPKVLLPESSDSEDFSPPPSRKGPESAEPTPPVPLPRTKFPMAKEEKPKPAVVKTTGAQIMPPSAPVPGIAKPEKPKPLSWDSLTSDIGRTMGQAFDKAEEIVSSFFDMLSQGETMGKVKTFLSNLFVNVYDWLKSNPVLVGLVGLAATVASFFGITIPTIMNPLDKRCFIAKFSDATRCVYNAHRTSSSMLDSFKEFGEALATTFGISTDSAINDFKDRLVTVNEQAIHLLSLAQSDPGKFVNSSEEMAEFETVMKDTLKLYNELAKISSKANLAVINPIWHQLNKTSLLIHQFWVKFKNCASERQEPVVLWLWGATNLGKSRLLNHIIEKLNEKLGTEYKTFTISKGPDYWNSFAGQKIIKIDDFGSYVGPEGHTDGLAVFNLKTNSAYNPNMAAIEDKNFMATPHFVIVASNHPTVPMNSGITDIPAFERRRDFFVRVTWPDHEGVCNDVSHCKHIQKVMKEKEERGGVECYKHLKLDVLEPCVSKVGIRMKIKGEPISPHDERIEQLASESVTVEALVDEMVKLHACYKANFESGFKNLTKKQAVGECVTEKWSAYPTVSISGPPGTGKSTIIAKFVEKHKSETKHIITKEDFEKFAAEEWKVPDKTKYVVFDDTSSLVTSAYFGSFLEKVRDRANDIAAKSTIWIIGMNRAILNPWIHKTFVPGSEDDAAKFEAQEFLYRRTSEIEAFFREKPGLRNALRRNKHRYVREDVSSDPDKIDTYVRYRLPSGGETVQAGVGSYLENFVPEVVEIRSMTELPLARMQSPDVSVEIDMPKNDFIKLIMNQSISELLHLFRSERVKFRSKNLTVSNIAGKILRTVESAASHLGADFDDLDEFFIECNNQRFLAHFEGFSAYMILSDAAYAIERGTFAYPMVHSITASLEQLDEIKKSISDVATAITTADVLKISATNISPWFCFVGDMVATVAKIGLSALSVSTSIREQEFAREAVSVYEYAQDRAGDFVRAEVEGIGNNISDKLYINDNKREKKGYKHVNQRNEPYREYYSDSEESQLNEDNSEAESVDVESKALKKNRRKKVERLRKEIATLMEEEELESKTHKKNRRQRERKALKKEAAIYDGDHGRKPKSRKFYEPINTEVQDFVVPQLQSENIVDIRGTRTEYAEGTDRRNGKKKRVRHTAVVKLEDLPPEGPPVMQATTDPGLTAIIYSVSSNMMTVKTKTGYHVCYALAIKENLCTTVQHITMTHKLEDLVAEDKDGNKFEMQFESEVYGSDRLDFRLIGKGAQFKDITKHLASMTYRDLDNRNAVLVHLSKEVNSRFPVLVIRSYRVKGLCHDPSSNKGPVALISFEGHRMGYNSIDVLTRAGDCGSILFILDANVTTGKIVGMHSRANKIVGYCRRICFEDYVDTSNQVEFEAFSAPLPPLNKYNLCEEGDDPEDPALLGHTTIRSFVPDKTKLYRNLAPIGEMFFEPAVLGPADERNPGHQMLVVEAKKWVHPAPELTVEDKNIILEATHEFALDVAQTIKQYGSRVKVLTKQEAINKYRHADHSEPVPLATSAGYPYALQTRSTGKREFITLNEKTGARNFTNCDATKRMFEGVTNIIQTAKGKTHLIEPIFNIHLKDEPLKLKKIYSKPPATRTISASPLHFTIAHRMYTHAGVANLMDVHPLVPIAVGMDPLSVEWDFMFKEARNIGSKVIALDYKGWDFTVHPFMIGTVLPAFWNTVYQALDTDWREEDDDVRDLLYKTMSRGLIAAAGRVYRIERGILSGVSTTAPDNSIVNCIMKIFDWKKIMAKHHPHLTGYDHFKRETFGKYYGDDFFLVVSDYVSEVFNGLTIRDIEEETFGVKLTAADKESEIVAYQDFKEITFLSRSFSIKGDRCYGKLEWHRVCKPTWWVHDSRAHRIWEEPDEQVRNMLHAHAAYESCLMEAVLHGKKKFEMIRVAAQKALTDAGDDLGPLPTFETLYAEMMGMKAPPEVQVGASFHKIPLEMIFRPSVPAHAVKFPNRTSWSYGAGYTYPGARHPPCEIPTHFKKLLDYFNARFGRRWNSILVNLYPVGGEIPWHRDNEPELDPEEGVGCFTVRGGGTLHIKSQTSQDHMFALVPGDFYIMEEECLTGYRHKRDGHTSQTISITFRKLD